MLCSTGELLWGAARRALEDTPGSWALFYCECGRLRVFALSTRWVVIETVRCASSDFEPWGFIADRYAGAELALRLGAGPVELRFDGASASAGATGVPARALGGPTPYGDWTGQQCVDEISEIDSQLPWVADIDAGLLRAAFAGREYTTVCADPSGVTADGGDVSARGCPSGRRMRVGIEAAALAALPSRGRLAMRAAGADYAVAFDADPDSERPHARITLLASPVSAETHEDVLCAMLSDI